MDTKELTEKLSKMDTLELMERLNYLRSLKVDDEWDSLAIKLQIKLIEREFGLRKQTN